MILVFDVGGTSLRVGCYCEAQHRLVRQTRLATPNFVNSPLRGPGLIEQLFRTMKDAANTLGLEYDTVVAALPGPVTVDGYVTALPTVLGAKLDHPCPAAALLQKLFGTPNVHVLNDITAAGYRYLTAEHQTFHIVSSGSGIGSKLFIDGKPLTGPQGDAGEIGHLLHPLCPHELQCDCSDNGHIGAVSSGRGTLQLFKLRAEQQPHAYLNSALGKSTPSCAMLDTRSIVNAFLEQDPWTLEVMDDAIRPLAHALATTRAVSGVASFILLGGFSCALGEPYRKRLAALCASYFDTGNWNDSIALGHADDNNGLIGCALYAQGTLRHEHESQPL